MVVTLELRQDKFTGRLPQGRDYSIKDGDIVIEYSCGITEARCTRFTKHAYICTLGKYQLLKDPEGKYCLIWEGST